MKAANLLVVVLLSVVGFAMNVEAQEVQENADTEQIVVTGQNVRHQYQGDVSSQFGFVDSGFSGNGGAAPENVAPASDQIIVTASKAPFPVVKSGNIVVDTQAVYRQMYDNFLETNDPYFQVVAGLYADTAKGLVKMDQAQDAAQDRGDMRRADAIARAADALADRLANDPYSVLSRSDFESGSNNHVPNPYPNDMFGSNRYAP